VLGSDEAACPPTSSQKVLKWTNISKRLFETFLSVGGRPQAPHQQGHPRRDAGEHMCRISPARFARAGLRGRRRNGRDGWPPTPRVGNGYTAALINFAFLAHAVLSTDEVVKALG
jgi:hypothetical protein